MRPLLLLSVIALAAGIATASSEIYNFNSYQVCKKDDVKDESLSSDDRATVIFREKSQPDPLKLVPDVCAMQFYSSSLLKGKLRVRFDGTLRYINDPQAKITFYDSKEVEVSKQLREFSQAKPITGNVTLVTTGRYLTVQVSRSVAKSKNFNVEMIIEPINSAKMVTLSGAVLVASSLSTLISGLL